MITHKYSVFPGGADMYLLFACMYKMWCAKNTLSLHEWINQLLNEWRTIMNKWQKESTHGFLLDICLTWQERDHWVCWHRRKWWPFLRCHIWQFSRYDERIHRCNSARRNSAPAKEKTLDSKECIERNIGPNEKDQIQQALRDGCEIHSSVLTIMH